MKYAISVIGLGKLGLCTAACLATTDFPVIGMDVQEEHVAGIKAGNIPFHEPGLEHLLAATRSKLSLTASIEEAVSNTTVTFIIVPTPSKSDGTFSNHYVLNVLREMAPLISKKNTFHIVNIVSTVMPGSIQGVFIPLLETLSGKKAGRDFGVAYNPEFVAIGNVIEDFLNPDLVLIGESDPYTGAILEEIYRSVCINQPYMDRTNLVNAEITKLAINCYCTMKISFANNLAAVCDPIHGAQADRICEILGHDSRIGSKYIKPGLGFGGPCFPRDNEAFIHFINTLKGMPDLQQAVIDINNSQARRFAEKIAVAAVQNGPQVALMGLAYKPNTKVTERSQALDIAHYLASRYPQLALRVYDPLAKEDGPWQQAESLTDCVREANVAAILVPYPEFFDLKWHTFLGNPSTILDFWG